MVERWTLVLALLWLFEAASSGEVEGGDVSAGVLVYKDRRGMIVDDPLLAHYAIVEGGSGVDERVLVSGIAKNVQVLVINRMAKMDAGTVGALPKKARLVIFDECHFESSAEEVIEGGSAEWLYLFFRRSTGLEAFTPPSSGQLREVWFRDCTLERLPSWVGEAKDLRVLDLKQVSIEVLDFNILSSRRMDFLTVKGCAVGEYAPVFTRGIQMLGLEISGNTGAVVPTSVFLMGSFCTVNVSGSELEPLAQEKLRSLEESGVEVVW